METIAGLKQMEGQLSVTADRLTALRSKIEDLLFRAQRIANAAKNGMPNNDTMYGYDLQHFRRNLRAFSTEIQVLPVQLGAIERGAEPDEKAVKFAQSVQRLSARLAQELKALHDAALLAHQHIRSADHKIEAWQISQEVEEMAQKGQSLPGTAAKIVAAVSAQAPGGAPPGPG